MCTQHLDADHQIPIHTNKRDPTYTPLSKYATLGSSELFWSSIHVIERKTFSREKEARFDSLRLTPGPQSVARATPIILLNGRVAISQSSTGSKYVSRNPSILQAPHTSLHPIQSPPCSSGNISFTSFFLLILPIAFLGICPTTFITCGIL